MPLLISSQGMTSPSLKAHDNAARFWSLAVVKCAHHMLVPLSGLHTARATVSRIQMWILAVKTMLQAGLVIQPCDYRDMAVANTNARYLDIAYRPFQAASSIKESRNMDWFSAYATLVGARSWLNMGLP